MMHGWQNQFTDGPKGVAGVAVFRLVAVVTSLTTADCSVVWCGVVCNC